MEDVSVVIPDKLYFKIGEVADLLDLPTHVLRFWESEFKRIKPKRTPSGQRLYRKSDVELILQIKHLLYQEKYTIPGAKIYMKNRHAHRKPDAPTLDEIRIQLSEIRELLDEE